MTATAAENPCVPSWAWQWKELPSLAITCPDALPDVCVGHNTVAASVTALPGLKWRCDVNQCMNVCKDETQVPLSPLNTWSLYEKPPGTYPLSGNGTTAEFDTIHGGWVRVHFKTEATVTSPSYWHDEAGCFSSAFRVFEVVDLYPDLPPKSGPSGNPPQYNYCIQDADLTITASPVPDAPAYELPACWTLTANAGPVTIVDKLTARLSLRYPTHARVTCTAGTSSKSVTKECIDYWT